MRKHRGPPWVTGPKHPSALIAAPESKGRFQSGTKRSHEKRSRRKPPLLIWRQVAWGQSGDESPHSKAASRPRYLRGMSDGGCEPDMARRNGARLCRRPAAARSNGSGAGEDSNVCFLLGCCGWGFAHTRAPTDGATAPIALPGMTLMPASGVAPSTELRAPSPHGRRPGGGARWRLSSVRGRLVRVGSLHRRSGIVRFPAPTTPCFLHGPDGARWIQMGD